jgi:3-oxoacyl-[acyl-carrier protein] reductase
MRSASLAAGEVRGHHRITVIMRIRRRQITRVLPTIPRMSDRQAERRSAVVFGARNLGRAVIELLVSDGWAVTGAARSRSTLDGVSAAGALAVQADVTDPSSVRDVLERAATAHGGVELVVNAAAAYGGEHSGPFGGGPIAEAGLDGFEAWAAAPARSAFSFLSASGRFALAQGRAATLVQVTGGSARRALPSRGLWAAGSFGVRAITNAAALELRARGIQVALLIVDAGIQPLDGSTRAGVAPEALAEPRRIADAVLFLANQDARSATHELQLTPLAENWTP